MNPDVWEAMPRSICRVHSKQQDSKLLHPEASIEYAASHRPEISCGCRTARKHELREHQKCRPMGKPKPGTSHRFIESAVSSMPAYGTSSMTAGVGETALVRSGGGMGEIHGLKGCAVFLIAIITLSMAPYNFLLLLACILTVFRISQLEQSSFNQSSMSSATSANRVSRDGYPVRASVKLHSSATTTSSYTPLDL